MAVDKEVEEYLEASGNPLLDDYMDPVNNRYGVFNPTQEPGFINRSTMLDDIPTTELYTLVIRNIPLLLNIKGFKGLFSYYGEVQECFLGKPAKNENTTWGKVSFLSKREGAAALESLHDQKPLRLQVSWFITKKTKENLRRRKEFEQDFDSTTRKSFDELIKRAEEKIVDINENCLSVGDLKHERLVTDERSRSATDNAGVEESNIWGYPLFQPRYDPHPCDHCQGKGRLVCSICQVWYCSYQCQVYSWPIHKYDCIPPPPLMHPAGSLLGSTPINPSSTLVVSRTNSSAAKVDVARKDESLNPSTKEKVITTQSRIVECSKKPNEGAKNIVTPGTNTKDETSYPSNQEEVKTSKSGNVELNKTQDEVKELSRTQEEVKTTIIRNVELSRNQEEVKELSRTQEEVKELSRTQEEVKTTKNGDVPLSRTQEEVKTSKSEIVLLSMNTYNQGTKSIIETKEDLKHKGSGDGFTKQETKKTSTTEFKFKPGIFHSLFSEPDLELNLKYELVSPICVFVSPSEFNVELSASRISSSKLGSLLQSLSTQPEPLSWKVEKSSPVAVKYNEFWFRGIAVKKKSGEFVVYLPDTGRTVCVNQSNLRPLSDQAFNYPVCSVQVSLGGVQPLNKEEWGDDACSLGRSFLNSENSSLDMIILGREPSGRLSVDILKNREHSLKDLLIQTKHGQLTPIQNCSIDCSFRKYELKESFYAKDCITSNSVNPIDMLPLTASRQKYSENSTPMESYRCTVSYVESPNSFFVSPLENQEVWENIMMDVQNPSTSLDLVEVGNICISEQGGLWSRCKIEQMSSNTGEVRVFFIDHGSRETKPVSSLRKLETHRNTPGLVRRVGLAGIQPLQGEVWSDESSETFKELVDIDGGSTFLVTHQTQDKDGYKVIMVDEEGMDMRDLLVELNQARFELEVVESEPHMEEINSMDRSIVDHDEVIFLNCGDSLNKIYVIKKLDRDRLNGELTTLNLKLDFFPVNLDSMPVLGGYVVCPSDNDRIFRRGRIENIIAEEMLAEVFLIDHGVNIIISWKELIPIPDGVLSSEGYAQMVLLQDVPAREALQFSSEISTLVNQETIYTVHISGDKVILSSQDFNLNTQISAIAYSESKIMDKVGNNFSDLDLGLYEVDLLSNASTSLFYVSTKELIKRWREKISRLAEESVKTKSTKGLKAEPGDLVLVSSGGIWCRALVKKCQDLNNIQVLLVDIGVEDEFSVTEIRPLPASLQQERFTSIPCVLQGSENLEPWETENLDVFSRVGFNTELRVDILGKIGWRNIVRFVKL